MPKERIVHFKEFMRFTPLEIVNGYKSDGKVSFDDGTVIFMTHREVALTRYIMVLMELFPKLDIVSSYAINNYYTNGIFTSKSINKCLESMLINIHSEHIVPNNDHGAKEKIYKTMFEIVNAIYNQFGYGNIEYCSSTNILDYLDIQLDPELIDSIRTVDKLKTMDSIDASYGVLDKLLTTDHKYLNNPISRAYRSGTVNPNQIKQLLAPRGYVTELDGSIFPIPIASSFTLGMNTIYDIAVESRSGAKALFLSTKAVQDSEYLAREMQLVTMAVSGLEYTDCGSTDYVDWYVRPAAEGKSDLPNLVGKSYYDEEAKMLKVISKSDKHLEGKTIKLRSAIKCKLEDSTKICSACFGTLSSNVVGETGFGHLCTVTPNRVVTQSILSTKHLTTSASSEAIEISEAAKKFFAVKEKDGYGFLPNILGKVNTKVYIMLTQKEAFGIKDIKSVESIAKLDRTRISRIEGFTVITENKAGREYTPITIKDGAKHGSFTKKFLEYIITNGYSLDDEDRIIIDVTKWKYASPIIKLPQLEFSFLALAKQVHGLLKTVKYYKDKGSRETPESLLQTLFDTLNSRLDINIALLEVIVYAFTIKNADEYDFDFARNVETQEVAGMSAIMPGRSLGGMYAHEYVAKRISNPQSYSPNRQDHPLDVMVKPNEVITKLLKQGKANVY